MIVRKMDKSVGLFAKNGQRSRENGQRSRKKTGVESGVNYIKLLLKAKSLFDKGFSFNGIELD